MSFVRFVLLIPLTTFVACVRMKHYTLPGAHQITAMMMMGS